MAFARERHVRAGCIVSCVGSLEQIHIRFANQKAGQVQKDFFEIVSLTGTFSETNCHFHIAVSDSKGQVFGGHLLDDSVIYTTAEIVVAELSDVEFHREIDSTFGYQELTILPSRN